MSDYTEHLISMAGGDGDPLDQIQRRADKATNGPWKWGAETSEWGDCGPNLETVARGPFYSDGSQGAEETVIGSWGHDANGILVEDHDAEFIAAARVDVPYLLAVVQEQAQKLEVVRADMANAWADGHESGFWNGRESSGHHEMRYVGLEHAQMNNPYRAALAITEPTP